MLVTTPEIVWHNKEPVFSIDFHHNGSILRLATGGADQTVKVWKLADDGCTKVIFLASLERHTKSVNTVRFSPNGILLASAGDDCVICLWKLTENKDANNENSFMTNENKENWSIWKMMRGHVEDVYDLCWSSDSKSLMSGSVDSTVILWNTSTGEKLAVLSESQHYIQGVAWGCTGYLASLGTDRCLRIYNDKFKCVHSILKRSSNEDKFERMFHDESMCSFFRRLSFSPDGLILVAPSAKLEGLSNVTWVFTISSFPKPVMYLPASDKPSSVVRFSPVFYQLRQIDDQVSPLFDLPYRMVFAVATTDSVIMYDTEQTTPIAIITDIHYTSITDLTWSDNGQILMVSSTDGYCTIIQMTQGELGVVYSEGTENLPMECSPTHELNEQIAKTPLSTHPMTSSPAADNSTVVLGNSQRTEGINNNDMTSSPAADNSTVVLGNSRCTEGINNNDSTNDIAVHRRVNLITLSSDLQ